MDVVNLVFFKLNKLEPVNFVLNLTVFLATSKQNNFRLVDLLTKIIESFFQYGFKTD